MALSFTIVVNVRQQFGDSDTGHGVFVGREKNFPFDCPSVSSDQALLQFQSQTVTKEEILEINGVTVFGGVPITSDVEGATSGPIPGGPNHRHLVSAASGGWVGNVLIINPGVLKDSGNVLRIASDGESFVIDNVVILYKTRGGSTHL